MRSANLRLVLIGMWLAMAALPARAFENFDRGKSASESFASDCAICHHTPAGLGASLDARGLASFLTEHYTASKDVANELANYLATQGKQAPAPQRTGTGTHRVHANAPADNAEKSTMRGRAKIKAHKKPAEAKEAKPNAGGAASGTTGSTVKPEAPKSGE